MFVCFDSLRLLHFLLLAVYLLSYRPVFPLGHQLHLPLCGGQIRCALQLMRILAPLPSTTLSQKLSGTQGTASFWERTEAPLPLPRPRCNFTRPKQLSPFLERLKLPFSSDEILSGYEDIVSSGTDQFITWVKTDPDVTLVRHMVDVQKVVAEFREASERRHDTSSQAHRFDKNVPNRSPVRKRLSIDNWNPAPRRGKEVAFEKQIAGKWHVITLHYRKQLSMSIMTFLQVGST